MIDRRLVPTIENIADALCDIVNSSSLAKRYPSKITRLDQSGGHTDIYFDQFEITLDQVTAETSYLISKVEKLGFTSFRDALISNCIELHLGVTALTGAPCDQSALRESAFIYATQIYWFLIGQQTFTKTIRVLPEIDEIKSFGDWYVTSTSTIDLTIESHQSNQSADDFISRLRQATSFNQTVTIRPDLESFQEESEVIALSLSLALKRPIRVDSIKIQSNPWKHYYFASPLRMWGALDISISSARAAGSLPKPLHPKIPQDQYQTQIEDWITLIKKHEGAQYPLGLIQFGFWLVLDSTNFSGIKRRALSYHGIHSVLTGMDGLTKDPLVTGGLDNFRRFFKAWKKISETHSPQPRSKQFFRSLYNLRNALAHGDFRSIEPALIKLNGELGPSSELGPIDGSNLGLAIYSWLSDVLSVFIAKPDLLQDLYKLSSTRPKARLWKRIKALLAAKLTNKT